MIFKMQIGPYTLANQLIVAPMAGVTDRPFRMLCKQMGAGMAVSEMITARPGLQHTRKSVLRANHEGETEPISVQIIGSNPAEMAKAAQLNVEMGAQIIDINMGCPAKKVCNVAAGSALMQNEALVSDILHAVVGAVSVPVTLKIRTGWSREHKNAVNIAKMAQDAGIAALAIHGRTREDFYQGDAEYDTIAKVKAAVSIPVVANGDIDSPKKAAYVLEKTQADGLMIGRAAQGRPWIFREILHYLTYQQMLPMPKVAEAKAILMAHLDELYHFYGERQGCRIARKHIAWYTQCLHGAKTFKQQLFLIEDAQTQSTTVAGYFDALAQDSERLVYVTDH